MSILKRLVSRRWIFATFLVVIAVGVMVRLGIWQLDRLEQRRAFNSRVLAQINQPELNLSSDDLSHNLADMEFRQVSVSGSYDHSQEIAIRNQYWNNQWGVHLVTPLVISGTDQAILVDRGWIPGEAYQSGDWSEFQEPGIVEVHGILRRSLAKADLGGRQDLSSQQADQPLTSWNFINIPAIDQQVSYALLSAYIQQAPSGTWTKLPHRSQPELEISEGPHLGYAIQWFIFASILGLGYPFYIRKRETEVVDTTTSDPKIQTLTRQPSS